LELEHYVKILKKKPGALASSLALQQAQTKIKNIYQAYYTRKEKDWKCRSEQTLRAFQNR
jgi:hypothetical protein